MGMTQAGMILGTAAYMAPEQARGKENVDKRADIWAFGVVLYELVTGKRLFHGEDVGELLAAVIMQEPDLSAVPAQLRPLLKRCLEKDPKKRLRDLGDMELLLAPPTTSASLPPAARRSALVPWMAAAALAIIAAAASWMAWGAPRPQEKTTVRLDLDFGPDRSVNATAYGADVVLSPDGTRLAYVSHNRLFTRQLDQPLATELAGTEGTANPFFYPDGQWIAFSGGGKLKKTAVAGGASVTLCDTSIFMGGSWGEDGTIVVAPSATGGLVRIPAEGG